MFFGLGCKERGFLEGALGSPRQGLLLYVLQDVPGSINHLHDLARLSASRVLRQAQLRSSRLLDWRSDRRRLDWLWLLRLGLAFRRGRLASRFAGSGKGS